MTFKDLGHLPTANKPEGLAPDDDPTFVVPYVEAIKAGVEADLPIIYEVDKPQVSATLTRHSSAATCMKEVALKRDGVDPTPMDEAGLHVTFVGTLMHAAWQWALEQKYGDAIRFETGSTIEDLTSGSGDALIPDESHVLELKTEGEFSYDKQAGIKGVAEGPKSSHMVQLALNVMGHDAERGTVVLLRRSSISAGQAERYNVDPIRRFGAQWTFTREQLQPLADEWLEQLRWVRDHDTDEVPRFMPHEMPRGARVVDPNSGRWEQRDGEDIIDTGAVWGGAKCKHYCAVSEACAKAWADGR